jgi:hypothetical protein
MNMKIIVTALFMIIAIFSQAQIQKGTKMVGTGIGGIGAVFGGQSDPVVYLSLNPYLLKFYSDRFAFGGGLNAGLIAGSGDGLTFTLGVSPVVRWYKPSVKDDRFFLQASTGVTTIIAGDPSFYFAYGAGAGYNRFFAENLALELGLHYNGLTGDVNGFNTIALGLGIQIFLQPKKEKSAPVIE